MSLVSVLLLQRNVPRAAKYYSLVGFRVAVLTESWAELEAGATKVLLKSQEGFGGPAHYIVCCSLTN